MATSQKTTIYVGGLPPSAATTSLLHAAFIPFGPILDIHLPPPPSTQASAKTHTGFAFITYADHTDALAAIDNMHLSEISSRPIRVTWAKAFAAAAAESGAEIGARIGARAVWTDEAWLREHGYLDDNVDSVDAGAGPGGDAPMDDKPEVAMAPETLVVTSATQRLRQSRTIPRY